MIEIKGLEKISALVKELNEYKGKSLESTVRATLQKAAQVVAKEVKKNIKTQIKGEGHKSTGTLYRSIVVRRYKSRDKNKIRYKIISRNKGFKKAYYSVMYEYGHINKGWNAKGRSSTRGRAPFRKAARSLNEGKISKEILEKASKQLQKQIDKAKRA